MIPINDKPCKVYNLLQDKGKTKVAYTGICIAFNVELCYIISDIDGRIYEENTSNVEFCDMKFVVPKPAAPNPPPLPPKRVVKEKL